MDGQALVRWLESMHELYGPPEGVIFRVAGRLVLLPMAGPTPGPPTPSITGHDLRRVHKQLLAAATDQPQTAKQLARHAGYTSCNTYVRAALRELVDWDMLRHVSAGYVRQNGPGK